MEGIESQISHHSGELPIHHYGKFLYKNPDIKELRRAIPTNVVSRMNAQMGIRFQIYPD